MPKNDGFRRSIVTGDNSWFLHFDPQTKLQNTHITLINEAENRTLWELSSGMLEDAH
jgi:hypothetical protein